jgi:hypothetical protein
MTQQAADHEMSQAYVEARRSRLLSRLERRAERAGAGGIPLPRDQIDYLVREAEELYWNELAWEELTDEERVAGGHLTELVFPGFLAFIDGLLLDTSPHGRYEQPQPHPEVVEEILLFLGRCCLEAAAALEQGADSGNLVWARAMTAELMDLVLCRLYRLSAAEREAFEARE